MKKKFFISAISLVLVCAILFFTPNVSAKYIDNSTGMAWRTVFAINKIVPATFVITDEVLTSDNLFGTGDPKTTNTLTALFDIILTAFGLSSGSSNPYALTNLEKAIFSVYNNTEQPMLITFGIGLCAKDGMNVGNGVNGTPFTFKITNENTNILEGEFVCPSTNTGCNNISMDNVSLVKGDDAIKSIIIIGDFYQYTATINPQNILGDTEVMQAGFVLQPGEAFNYSISMKYGGSSFFSTFTYINMIAVPYTPAS